MQQEYEEKSEDHIAGLSDDDLYFQHVIQEDHELLAMDMMLKNALSEISD